MVMTTAVSALGRRPVQFFGGWEVGLLAMMALLYLVGAFINPKFFASADVFNALLRDGSRYAVMAVGMTFVIANKDLDLSVGSTYGLIGVAFAYVFDPNHYDLGVVPAILVCLVLGTVIGLINGVLVTFLRVPAFIATLTMLLIGRGFVLGLTGGQLIGFRRRRPTFDGSSSSARPTPGASTTRFRSPSWSSPSAPSCSPRRAGATRPSPPAATSRRRSTPAYRRAGCASAPTSCRRSARRSPASWRRPRARASRLRLA